MIPDLGKYNDVVLSAYGIGVFMLIVLVLVSLRANAKSKKALEIEEAKVRKNG